MALRIQSSPSESVDMTRELREAILKALPGAKVEVGAASPGHFEIQVTSDAFEGKNRVRQQQLVYAAIAHLMKGDDAPVHAIDHLKTALP